MRNVPRILVTAALGVAMAGLAAAPAVAGAGANPDGTRVTSVDPDGTRVTGTDPDGTRVTAVPQLFDYH